MVRTVALACIVGFGVVLWTGSVAYALVAFVLGVAFFAVRDGLARKR